MAIVDCVADRAKSSAGGDPIWNVGGPDAGLSMRDQGELLAKIVEKEPKLLAVPTARARRGRGVKAQALALSRLLRPLLQVPIGLFDVIINGIQWLADLRAREGFGFIPEGVAQQLEDAAELGRIGEAPRSSPRASPSSPSLSKRAERAFAPLPLSLRALLFLWFQASTTRSRTCSRPTPPRSTAARRSRRTSGMTLRPSLRRYGSTTLEEHYRKIAVEGQEYDPYTTLFASKKQREDYSADAASS